LVSMGGGRDTTAGIMAGIGVGTTVGTDTIGNCGVRCGAEMQFWLKTASKFFLPGIKTARSWSEICNRVFARDVAEAFA
jgi:hypothetical protein